MKKNGFEIGVIIFMVVFSLILFGMYLAYEIYLSSRSFTIIMSPYTALECKKWNCKNVSDNLQEYNNKEYNVFIDGISKGINSVYYNSGSKKFYVFNENNENIFKSGRLFVHDKNSNITQLSFNEEEIDMSELNSLLELTSENFDVEDVLKVSIDFDSDQEDEILYVINRKEIEGFSLSLLIYHDGNEYFVLDKEKYEDVTESSTGYINNVIDIFNDGKKEFIYTKEFFSNTGSCNVIYRLRGSKFVSVNECEIVE